MVRQVGLSDVVGVAIRDDDASSIGDLVQNELLGLHDDVTGDLTDRPNDGNALNAQLGNGPFDRLAKAPLLSCV